MNIALFVVVLLVQQVGSPAGSPPNPANAETKVDALQRNPFRPVDRREIQNVSPITTPSFASPTVDNATASANVSPPTIPPILDRLSSIAISKNGMKLAMFGREIVSVGDEIQGFLVTDITIDGVVLQKESFIVSKNLEILALRRNQSRAASARSGGINKGNPFDFLSSNENDASRFSDVANMVQKVNSLNNVLKPFIGEQINLDGLSELLK